MSFVILNRKPYDSKPAGDWFVSLPGSEKSYTLSIHNARRFPSREAAQRDACGNESVVDLREYIRL